jgi:hypothetical protein
MSGHAKELWKVWSGAPDTDVFKKGRTVCAPCDDDPSINKVVANCDYHTPEIAEANAERIVACVNAMAGVDDPAKFMADVQKAMRRSAEGWENAIDLGILPERYRGGARILRQELRALLSRMGGGE